MALHCPECGKRVASKANLKAHQGPNGSCTHDANKKSVTPPASVTPSRATAQVTKSPPKPAIVEQEPPTPVTGIRSKLQLQGHSHTSRISIFFFGRKRRQPEQKKSANARKTAPELFQPFPVGVVASQVCPHCHNSGLSSPGTPWSYCSG